MRVLNIVRGLIFFAIGITVWTVIWAMSKVFRSR
jgi:hypothetical protein